MQSARALRVAAIMTIVCSSCFVAVPTGAKLLPYNNPIEDKNFFLFVLIKRNPDVVDRLMADKDLATVATERENTILTARQACKGDVACLTKAFFWTDEEIEAVSLALDRLVNENLTVRSMVDSDVRSSGAYILFAKEPPGQLLANAWQICARGINEILSVYGEGLPPRYPLIDSISVNLKSTDLAARIPALASASTKQLFFEPSLDAALELLTLNQRDEASRLEPMELGINAAAFKRIPAVSWENYAYSVIVVPGAGSSDYNTPLSEAARRRCILAVAAFHSGKVAFLLVSGGYVHPSQTHYSEAVEMKRALIDDYHIPESAILVDPHARHTTTNMRNAAREILRYGLPADKPALVVSDSHQIAYIASQTFADRCIRELGYLPYRLIRQDSDTALVFAPLFDSLQQDPMDPLDP